MDEACSMHGKIRCTYAISIEKIERKRPLGRPRREWEYNIKMNIMERCLDDVHWIHLAKGDRLQAVFNMATNLQV
jgi:hypothetical protein